MVMRWEDIGEIAEEMWHVYATNMKREPWNELSPGERVAVRAMAWKAWRKFQEFLRIEAG
jgi:hypothetical protein